MLDFTYSITFSYPSDQTATISYFTNFPVVYFTQSDPAQEGDRNIITMSATLSFDPLTAPYGRTTFSLTVKAYTTISLQDSVYLFVENISDLENFSISVFLEPDFEHLGVWRNLGLKDSLYCFSLSTKHSIKSVTHSVIYNNARYIPAFGSIVWVKKHESMLHSFSFYSKGIMLNNAAVESITASQAQYYARIPYREEPFFTYSGFNVLNFGNEYIFYARFFSSGLYKLVFYKRPENVELFTLSFYYTSLSFEIVKFYIIYDGNDFNISVESQTSTSTGFFNLPGLQFSDALRIGKSVYPNLTLSGNWLWASYVLLDYTSSIIYTL